MKDTFTHKGLRRKLIQLLKDKGINQESVLAVMDKVPRHLFFEDKVFQDRQAYEDIAFPIGAGQTISQPYTVAFQTSLLEINKTDKVLEIGTGSGYQTAILCELASKVYSIERQRELFMRTKPLLKSMHYRAKLYYGDGYKGLPAFKPYNKIIITCGAPFIPQELLEQLAVYGKMVIPVGDKGKQKMLLITKNEDGTITEKDYGDFMFVPMLSNKE